MRLPPLPAALAGLTVLLAHATAAALDVPPQFVVESMAPGASFEWPTSMAFLPGGRMLVAEKRGKVWSVHLGVKHSTPLLQLDSEVLNNGDRGLVGLAVDPNYASNRYIYLLYTVDPDSNSNDDNDDAFGRLTRYQVSATDSHAVIPGSRTILMGASWRTGSCSGSYSHTIGGLEWGSDGTLLVTTGEGAQFDSEEDDGGQDPGMFGPGRTDPFEDIGAFRAQYIGSLAGKVLRIDPATGHGLPSNPFWDGDPGSPRSRVWAYGLRNPFRFTVRPGTGSASPAAGDPGTLYVGDVGWSRHEELNLVKGAGRNLGWPCYEGHIERQEYQEASPAHHDCSTIGTPENPSPLTMPMIASHHTDEEQSLPPVLAGNCIVAGVFYTGDRYPGVYRPHLFIGDYGRDWIKIARIDATDGLLEILEFGEDMGGPVCFRSEPGSGDVVYAAITAGEIRRIRYTGIPGNTAPVAIAGAAPDAGVVPLEVDFSSAASFDPDGDPVTRSWLFGDGQGSSAANPTHTYALPGPRQAILTLDDGRGGIGRDTVLVIGAAAGFPSAPVLDAFDRPDGPLGGSWVDPVNGLAGLSVLDSALAQICCAYGTPVWNGGPYGADQEVFITMRATSPGAPEHDLMLKLQGASYNLAHVEVRYDDARQLTEVSTFHAAQGWVTRGTLPYTFAPGDRFGARGYANGTVEVFKNGAAIGAVSLDNWPFATAGGRIGLTLDAAYQSRLDDFGGGNAVFSSNTSPLATIDTPLHGSFFAAGEPVALQGAGWDAQQSAGSLGYQWVVNIHHNTHVHPGSFVAGGTSASMTPGNHDDGTGVFYEVTLQVTDNGGLADTARVSIYPEVDLSPSAVSTTPNVPNTAGPTVFSFVIRNAGRMLAPFSRWRLVAGGATLAQGDTLVAPLDSVLVSRELPPALPAGDHVLRVVVDTLGAVVETVETNNAATRTLTVEEGQVGVPKPPARLALSAPRPNPTRAGMALTLDLPSASRVGLVVHDLLGREVWRAPAAVRDVGRWLLEWPGLTQAGRVVPSGVYLVRVTAGAQAWDRRVAVIR